MAQVAWAFVHDQGEWEDRRRSRVVQTVLESSSDEEELVVKKEKEKEKEEGKTD